MELYIIKHRNCNIYYKYVISGHYREVLDLRNATRYASVEDVERAVNFLIWDGKDVKRMHAR